ncbi:MAG TPA: hypothetical protein ENK05_09570 [Gammaproteobacteria bacterium]|nr:hypothetical protein [Gammaproteobacteria bacterium]
MITRLFRRPPAFRLDAADPARLPVLGPDALIDLLGQHNRLRSIRRLAAAGEGGFNQLYQPAIDRFIESAQLAPASIADHHAGYGGLVVHTLEVIEHALRARKEQLLPQNADSQLIRDEEHIWTYAVFAGALLHDAGKLLTLTRLSLPDGTHWTPQAPRLADLGATHYAIEFVRAPYALQHRLNATLFHLLPATGRDWLAQNMTVMTQLTAWLFGDPYEWGVIGDIVRGADGASVAANRAAGGERQRLPNAPAVPMVERMTRALRQLIHDDALKFNRSGAAGWVEGAYTYLVCGVIANKVAERLREEGSTDVPTDNTRLFDIWQDHGYVVATPQGRAIWTMQVIGDGYCHKLSMLKFETRRLFHPSRRPAAFAGRIERCEEADAVSMGEVTAPTPVEDPVTDSGQAVEQSAEPPPPAPESDPADTAPTPAEAPAAGAAPTPTGRRVVSDASLGLERPELGQHFLSWVRAGLADRGLAVNKVTAMVHTLPEGVVLLSPAIFMAYLKHHGLAADDEDTLKKQYKRVQSRLQKLDLHRRTDKRVNVHTVLAQGPNKESKLYGWLFPPSVLYGDQPPPPPNRHLKLLSGVLD